MPGTNSGQVKQNNVGQRPRQRLFTRKFALARPCVPPPLVLANLSHTLKCADMEIPVRLNVSAAIERYSFVQYNRPSRKIARQELTRPIEFLFVMANHDVCELTASW